ncbi:MAG: aminopeptidase P family N-terminal domain-containing protein, partial [Candidatus Binatia bacterium]
MASKLTYGNEISDWQERLNTDRMRRERIERARKIMRKHHIPVLLEANSSNIRYLTGLRGFNYPM